MIFYIYRLISPLFTHLLLVFEKNKPQPIKRFIIGR